MAVSKVYFTNFHTTLQENQQQKLSRLLLTAGMDQISFENKYVAIKIHFGEPGNLAYLRPNYARTVVDLVKQLGGKPFLTDCNTLYVGGRKNAIDHIESAYVNGFTPYSTGCHILIGDGLKGTDDVEVPVDGEYIQTAKIGRAIMDADIFISLTHFKGHESTVLAAQLKTSEWDAVPVQVRWRCMQPESPACRQIAASVAVPARRSAPMTHRPCMGGRWKLTIRNALGADAVSRFAPWMRLNRCLTRVTTC